MVHGDRGDARGRGGGKPFGRLRRTAGCGDRGRRLDRPRHGVPDEHRLDDVRAASGGIGGTLELRSGSPAGPLLGEVAIAFTGGWDRPVSPTVALSVPGHGVRLFAVFSNPAWSADTADLFTLDWLRFNGPGAGGSPREPDSPGAPDSRR
ncbi:carbohydrate-binding protein [Streptomyces laculatispora]|uniref:carbohydrate-binding protein n=1 Tax=Streptomyces laculatispora TaxID=887464 RepID=UPI001A940895|nr:carbohydrate-binding protein [Streptomyces laculatispora]